MTLLGCRSQADLGTICPDEMTAVSVLLEENFLILDPVCDKCGNIMKLRIRGESKEWRCRLTKSKDCSVRSVKKGSFFSRGSIPLKTTLQIAIMWMNRYTGLQIQNETSVSAKTVVDYKNFLREICTRHASTYGQIGGPGKIVQIDETAIHSRKYGRGEKERQLTWILGGVEVGSRRCFAVIVKNRTAKTMLPILKRFIHKESVVHSDLWKSYATLKHHFNQHKTVNHSVQYTRKDEDGTIVHTNQVESMWQRMKKPLKQANGTSEALLPSYIDEFIVREHEGDDFCRVVMEGIRDFRK